MKLELFRQVGLDWGDHQSSVRRFSPDGIARIYTVLTGDFKGLRDRMAEYVGSSTDHLAAALNPLTLVDKLTSRLKGSLSDRVQPLLVRTIASFFSPTKAILRAVRILKWLLLEKGVSLLLSFIPTFRRALKLAGEPGQGKEIAAVLTAMFGPGVMLVLEALSKIFTGPMDEIMKLISGLLQKLRSALKEPIERFKEWLAKSLGISTDTLACGKRKLVCATLGKGGREVSVRLLLQKDKASMPLAQFLRTVKTDCKNKKSKDLEQKKQKAMRLGKELLTKPQALQATGQGGRRARPQAAAPLPSSKRWPKYILQQLASTLEDLLQGCCAQTTGKGSCFVKGTLVDIGHGQKPLGPGWIAGTCRVLTHTANEGGALVPEQGPPQDHEDRRLIYLVVRAGQPDEVFLTLLRPLQWLKDYRVSEGAIIPIDLPEMAVEGDAFVLKVAPCPMAVEGEGSLVTGTFAHKSGEVLELKVASEQKPLGVTASHWFWSIDRQQWVPAGMLQKGEKLLAKERVTKVESISASDEPLPVYNLEVEGDHVYRVGHSGVLVHNMSASAGKVSCVEDCTINAVLAVLKGDSPPESSKKSYAVHEFDPLKEDRKWGNIFDDFKEWYGKVEAKRVNVFYVLKAGDKILKVGKQGITSKNGFNVRFKKYSNAVKFLKDYWPEDLPKNVMVRMVVCRLPSSFPKATDFEKKLRDKFGSDELPWDNSFDEEGVQRLGRRGAGVPCETNVPREHWGRKCVWAGKTFRRVTKKDLQDYVNAHGENNWEGFAKKYCLRTTPEMLKIIGQWWQDAKGGSLATGKDECANL